MTQQEKDQWIEMLQSGEYKQGKGALKTSAGRYCCLGVLCELYLKTAKNTNLEWLPDGTLLSIGDNVVYLPEEIEKYYELHRYTQLRLALANDRAEKFDEVIELIKDPLRLKYEAWEIIISLN